ncbi:MAG: twin-arginine translocation pathway signal protein, partial [Hydrogenophaga sp.]|nr:twin-arginine translocation pathway signal protein [Hydrogenophaga sp.]
MDRRSFLRLTGGGVIAAATATTLPGCSSTLPPEAIAAWQGPGNEPDVRRWILAHAILAPHSHNLQSWL